MTPMTEAFVTPRSAVCVLIENTQGQVLAVSRRHDASRWGYPGGKVDLGETNLTSVMRECQEEVGLTLEAAALEPLFSGLCPGKGPQDSFWVTTYLYKEAVPEQGGLSAEDGLLLKWVRPEDLAQPGQSPFAGYNEQVLNALTAYRSLRLPSSN